MIHELDVVEVTSDQPGGLVQGARGTVVAVHQGSCTIEFVDADGYTIGLFELPAGDLEVVERAGSESEATRES